MPYKDPEKQKQYHKEYRKIHEKELLEYRAVNRDEILKKRRSKYKKDKYDPKQQAIRLYDNAKLRASRQSLPFDIDVSDIIIPEQCPVLGIPLQVGVGRPTDNSPTLDKIIPELGYVKGNVIVVSYKANRIKTDATIDELRKVANFYSDLLSPTAT